MGSVKVKICGLKKRNDVKRCMQLGVDTLGFVTEYPVSVPWNLSRSEALPLVRMVKPPRLSCIVTGGTPEKIIGLAAALRPAMVQLHYQETLEDTIIIADALRELHIDVIKTIPPAIEDRLLQFGTADIKTIVDALCSTNIYGLLADSRVPANASAPGTKLDLHFCSQVMNASSKPVIIAGGINTENVRDVVKRTGAAYIDIMTGVESIPGEKDEALLSHLLSSIGDL